MLLTPPANSTMPRARRMLTLLDPARIAGPPGILAAPDPLTSDLLHLLVGRALSQQGERREIDVTDDELESALRQRRGTTGWSPEEYAHQEQAVVAAGDVWLHEELECADYPRRSTQRTEMRDIRFMNVTSRTLISRDPVAVSEWSLMTGNWPSGIPSAVGDICLKLVQLPWSGGGEGHRPAWTKALGKVLLAQVLGPQCSTAELPVQQLLTHARLPAVPDAQQHFESGLAALQQIGLHLGCGCVNAQQHRPWLERDVQFVIPSVLTNW